MAKKQTAKEPKNPRRGKVSKPVEGEPAAFVAGDAEAPKVFREEEIAEEMRMYWRSGDGDNFMLQGADNRWQRWPQQATIDFMRSLPGRMVAIKALMKNNNK